MSTEIISEGQDFVIVKLDRGFGGRREVVLKVDGETGIVTVNGQELAGIASAPGDFAITDDLTVSGDSALTGNLDVTGNATVIGDMLLGGGEGPPGTVTVYQNLVIQNNSVSIESELDLNDGGILNAGSIDASTLTGTGLQIATDVLRASGSGIGFFGATIAAQPATTGELTGFTAGSGTAVKDDSTFTGDIGTKAYTLGDIVAHLKTLGLIASS